MSFLLAWERLLEGASRSKAAPLRIKSAPCLNLALLVNFVVNIGLSFHHNAHKEHNAARSTLRQMILFKRRVIIGHDVPCL
jgi:hypothetical protein